MDPITIAKYPELNCATLEVQLNRFKLSYPFNTVKETAAVLRGQVPEARGRFSQVEALIRLLIVVPIGSAEAERSFNALRRLKTLLKNPPYLFDYKEKTPSEQQEWTVILGQEELEPPHIKEELKELWTSQEEEQLQRIEADNTKLQFPPLPAQRENDEENPPSSELHQSQTEENKQAEPSASTSTEQMKTEPDGEDFGLSEQTSNLDQDGDLESTSDGGPLPSDYCGSETEDSDDDWNKTRQPRSGLDLKDNEIGHQRSTKKKPFTRSICGERFTQRGHMQRHMRTHTGEKLFSCTICGKEFSQRGKLQPHMRTHTGEEPFSCSVCGKEFARRGNVKTHMRIHTGEKPFSCSVCGNAFSQRGGMLRHMRIHTGEKPFSCTICGKEFSQRGKLQPHMRTHTGEKPFSCSVCGKRFAKRGNMKAHMRIHTGEKPFTCSICGAARTSG
ncbi:zinc finger and SCAN domain-containing protein 2-like [Lampris incognitus]|uniref:zinc finger and SCAN domain-containing protein 2-like n=1 Tax=Lampris incognitus TaxID=2546036 RepID=UPI0024B5A0B1|nr:zinc finger and SCAN domain-containing protein 2-like [Lampris incognitus]